MYEMTTEIPFTRTGADRKLKLHEAVFMMMDVCQFQEYQEQAFCDYLRRHRLAIFLFSIQLDVLRVPEFRERVKTAVKIYGCRSIYGLRRLTMRDEAGRLCFIANAAGAFFDLNAKKALKLELDELPLKFDEAEPMETLPRKIPIPVSGGAELAPVAVTPSQLDPNGHLTSANYFAVAGDALPPDFSYNRVRMEFKRQFKPGEKVCPVRFQGADGRIVIDLRNQEGLSGAAAEFSTADLSAEAAN